MAAGNRVMDGLVQWKEGRAAAAAAAAAALEEEQWLLWLQLEAARVPVAHQGLHNRVVEPAVVGSYTGELRCTASQRSTETDPWCYNSLTQLELDGTGLDERVFSSRL